MQLLAKASVVLAWVMGVFALVGLGLWHTALLSRCLGLCEPFVEDFSPGGLPKYASVLNVLEHVTAALILGGLAVQGRRPRLGKTSVSVGVLLFGLHLWYMILIPVLAILVGGSYAWQAWRLRRS